MAMGLEDQKIITLFHGENPELSQLHGNFLIYAAEALDAMPQPRFGKHDYNGIIPHDEFVRIFGIDTSHHLHPIRQHWVLMDRLVGIDHARIDEYRRRTLGLTAIVHDMGEAKSKDGDVIYGEPKDEADETQRRHEAIRAIAPERAEEIINRTEPVLSDPGNIDYPIFRLSEHIGYVLTAYRAAKIYLQGRSDNTGDLPKEHREIAAVIATDVNRRTVGKLKAEFPDSRALELTFRKVEMGIKATDTSLEKRNPALHAVVLSKIR